MNAKKRLCLILGIIAGAYWFLHEPDPTHISAVTDKNSSFAGDELQESRNSHDIREYPAAATDVDSKNAPSTLSNASDHSEVSQAETSHSATMTLKEELRSLHVPGHTPANTGEIPFPSDLKKQKPCMGSSQDNWVIGGDAPNDYEVVVGSNLVGIRGIHPKSGLDIEVLRCIPVELTRGKLLKFSMGVKSQDVSDYATLIVRALDENRQRLPLDPAHKSFRDSFEWKRLTLETEIPSEAIEVHVGIVFESPGRAWFTAPLIEISSIEP